MAKKKKESITVNALMGFKGTELFGIVLTTRKNLEKASIDISKVIYKDKTFIDADKVKEVIDSVPSTHKDVIAYHDMIEEVLNLK